MDASYLISLGIGSPASTKYLLTFGLSIQFIRQTPTSRTYKAAADLRSYTVPEEDRVKRIQDDYE